jgi:hypothetical protein
MGLQFDCCASPQRRTEDQISQGVSRARDAVLKILVSLGRRELCANGGGWNVIAPQDPDNALEGQDVTPEPASALLMLAGLETVFGGSLRRRARSCPVNNVAPPMMSFSARSSASSNGHSS